MINEGWFMEAKEQHRVKIEMDGFRCLRCGYEWVPRIFKEREEPTICPRCKSPYWNKARTNKVR